MVHTNFQVTADNVTKICSKLNLEESRYKPLVICTHSIIEYTHYRAVYFLSYAIYAKTLCHIRNRAR